MYICRQTCKLHIYFKNYTIWRKAMKKLLSALLIGVMMFTTACSNQTPQENKETKTNQEQSKEPQEKQEQGKEEEKSEGTIKFTDSSGREVEIPSDVQKIAPSGNLAQIMLYSIAPDKMVGWGSKPKEKQMKYIDKKYADKPEFGAFYGKNANLNMEALISASPQIVIDLGEKKDDIKEGMDTIQTQTNIPTVFIEPTFEKLPQSYETLGEVLNEKEQGEKLATYCKEALDLAKTNSEKWNLNRKFSMQKEKTD